MSLTVSAQEEYLVQGPFWCTRVQLIYLVSKVIPSVLTCIYKTESFGKLMQVDEDIDISVGPSGLTDCSDRCRVLGRVVLHEKSRNGLVKWW